MIHRGAFKMICLLMQILCFPLGNMNVSLHFLGSSFIALWAPSMIFKELGPSHFEVNFRWQGRKKLDHKYASAGSQWSHSDC